MSATGRGESAESPGGFIPIVYDEQSGAITYLPTLRAGTAST